MGAYVLHQTTLPSPFSTHLMSFPVIRSFLLQVRNNIRLMDIIAKEKGLALMCGIDSAVPQHVLLDLAAFQQLLQSAVDHSIAKTAR